MVGTNPLPPLNGEGDRAKRGGGDSKFQAQPAVVLARKLRKEMSPPERPLWQQLRLRPAGLRFRRQHPVGPYVADFCCLSERLIIEVDGEVHDFGERAGRDQTKRRFLEENGFRVIRVSARRVFKDAAGTANAIVALVTSPLHRPAAGPPPRSGEVF